jgi:hypothetical protein
MLKIHLIYMHFSITSQKANKEPHTTVLILISSLCDFSAFHQWGWSLPVLCCTGSFGKSNMFFVKKMLECFLFVLCFYLFCCVLRIELRVCHMLCHWTTSAEPKDHQLGTNLTTREPASKKKTVGTESYLFIFRLMMTTFTLPGES